MKKLSILISNDDGIDSAGLKALVDVFSKDADVYVIAPEGERSSNSHHLNFRGKLRIEERKIPGTVKAYVLWGTPADCIHTGLCFLFKNRIDLVVSGINRGLNVSSDIMYSGTDAAAREAYLQGVPSVAVSLYRSDDPDYRTAAEYGKRLAYRYYESGRRDFFLNINVPDRKEEEIKGILICDRQTKIHYRDEYSLIEEDGTEYINISSKEMWTEADPSDLRIDYCAVMAGYVGVSPLGNRHILPECAEDLKEILK